MQATRTFGGPGIGKRALVLVLALLAAFALGATGGYVAKSIAPGHVAQPGAARVYQSTGGAEPFRAIRGGLQTPGDDAASQSSAAAVVDEGCMRIKRTKAC